MWRGVSEIPIPKDGTLLAFIPFEHVGVKRQLGVQELDQVAQGHNAERNRLRCGGQVTIRRRVCGVGGIAWPSSGLRWRLGFRLRAAG